MGSRDDTSATSDSSTLSEFVRRRWNREVPVLGGNPRTGASEVASAITESLRAAGLFETLSDVRNRLGGQRPVGRNGQPLKELPDPIQLRDGEATFPEPRADDFYAAAELDPDKLRMLLDASLVVPSDVERYRVLLTVARDSVAKKKANMELSSARKAAAASKSPLAALADVYWLYERDVGSITAVIRACGIDKMSGMAGAFATGNTIEQDMMRALTHESCFNGRTTNRGLAQVGDAALKLMLVVRCNLADIAVRDVSDYIQSTQSNVELRNVGVRANLEKFVKASPDIDVNTRTVMSMFVEAVYGVVYLHFGVLGLFQLNRGILQVCDFEKMGVDEAQLAVANSSAVGVRADVGDVGNLSTPKAPVVRDMSAETPAFDEE